MGAIMKKILLNYLCRNFLTVSFSIIIIISLQTMTFAQDISISDFRIPETRYQRLTGSLSGGWGKSDNSNNDYLFNSSNSSRYSNIQSDLDYSFANYNENHSLEINLHTMGQANHQSNEGNSANPPSYSQSSRSWTDYSLDIRPEILYSNYLIPNKWFWFTEGSGDYSFTQYTDNYSSTYSDGFYFHDTSFVKSNSWNASLGGGIGYGKLRDGSPVFAVLRILDKLAEDSALTRSLTKDEVLRIVEVFAKKVEYSYMQDRYVKYFMEDIFSQLQKMGVLKENTAMAFSVLRAVEVISERIEPRLFGWRVRIGVQRRYLEEVNVRDRSTIYYYTDSYLWNFHDYVSLELEYGYPLSLNLQVNSNLSIEIPRIDYQRKVGYIFQLSGIYQVGERIDAIISGSVSRTATPRQNENDFMRNVQYNANITFRFFIENNVNFDLSCGYSELHQNHYSLPASMNNMTKSPTVQFGVNYRFI
jgi:hypothetical protein